MSYRGPVTLFQCYFAMSEPYDVQQFAIDARCYDIEQFYEKLDEALDEDPEFRAIAEEKFDRYCSIGIEWDCCSDNVLVVEVRCDDYYPFNWNTSRKEELQDEVGGLLHRALTSVLGYDLEFIDDGWNIENMSGEYAN